MAKLNNFALEAQDNFGLCPPKKNDFLMEFDAFQCKYGKILYSLYFFPTFLMLFLHFFASKGVANAHSPPSYLR